MLRTCVAGDGFNFTYYLDPPQHAPIRPLFGPQLGGTVVAMPGSFGRGTEYVCRVGDAAEAQLVPVQWSHADAEDRLAQEYDGAELMCAMPSVAETRDFGVGLSMNGQQYQGHAHGYAQAFTYHAQMRAIGIAPVSGPVGGATDVLVRLDNVSLSARQLLATLLPAYVCRFDDIWQPARLDAPPLPLGEPSNATEVRRAVSAPRLEGVARPCLDSPPPALTWPLVALVCRVALWAQRGARQLLRAL